MKPNWKDAPEWANWLAQARHGSWWWFGNLPEPDDSIGTWIPKFNGDCLIACQSTHQYIKYWMHTIEKKPTLRFEDQENPLCKKCGQIMQRLVSLPIGSQPDIFLCANPRCGIEVDTLKLRIKELEYELKLLKEKS